MSDFLPDNYKVPTGNDKYMKFGQGENKFRALSSAIIGTEFWVMVDGKKKPYRIKSGGVAPDVFEDDPKHFWAFVVWNYQEEKVQILELTQRSIQKSMASIAKDPDWGDPKKYDIVVSKKGTTKEDTEYQVFPKPPTKLDDGIVQLYKDMHINLEALYDGRDPFGDDDASQTGDVNPGTKAGKTVEVPF